MLRSALFGASFTCPTTTPISYSRTIASIICANRGGAHFWQRGGKSGFQLGRFDWRADCEISKIDRLGSKYRVQSYCHAKREMFVGDPLEFAKHFELWQSKTGMHWRELEEEEDRK
jgi:hypothetical protein